jgi:hypothetical protein
VCTVPLPWNLLRHVPLLSQALPIRFSLYTSLLLAIMTAMWFSTVRLPPLGRPIAAVLMLGSLLPNTSAGFWSKAAKSMATPPFFSQGLYRRYLVEGETVVVPPYDWEAGSESMMWQAETQMYFRVATGYFAFAPKAAFQWPIVKAALRGGALADETDQWLAFLAAHDVSAVVLSDSQHSPAVERMLAELQVSPLRVKGVLIYRIRSEMLAPYRNLSSVDMEALDHKQSFARLVVAAHKYLVDGGDPVRLAFDFEAKRDPRLGQWVPSDLWDSYSALSLHAEHDGRIAVGVKGTYEALAPLIKRYGVFAQSLYFPYPSPLGRVPPPNGYSKQQALVMVFDSDGFSRAASLARAEPPQLALGLDSGDGAAARAKSARLCRRIQHPEGSPCEAQTNGQAARTTGMARQTIFPGIAGRRVPPRTVKSTSSTSGRSAICSRRCSFHRGHRCCWAATSSAGLRRATTTPIAKTTKSAGWIGRESKKRGNR